MGSLNLNFVDIAVSHCFKLWSLRKMAVDAMQNKMASNGLHHENKNKWNATRSKS